MVTPDATPRWLQPRRYFRDLLNAQHDWIKSTFVDSTDTVRTVFRTTEQTFLSRQDGPFEPHTVVAPWQEEFQAFIFGWLVQMGHADWEPIFRWKIGSTIARTDGRSGWIRAYCTPNHQLRSRASGLALGKVVGRILGNEPVTPQPAIRRSKSAATR